MIRRRLESVALILALALALFLAPAAAPALAVPIAKTYPPADEGPTPIAKLQPAQRDNFALFRTRPERFPNRDRRLRAIFAPPDARLSFALAQRATPQRGEASVWAIPGDGWICIYLPISPGAIGGTGCGRTAEVLREGLAFFGFRRGTPSQTFGLVPDGVAAVRLKRNPKAVAVLDNAFVARGRGLRGLITPAQA